INWIKSRQFAQYLREDGPRSHAYKQKTPTTGGVIFALVTVVLSQVAWSVMGLKPQMWHYLPLAVGLVCGILGFLDDFAKISSRSNTGISGYLRLAIELLVGLLLGLALVVTSQQISFVPGAQLFQSLFSGTLSPLNGFSAIAAYVPPAYLFIGLSTMVVAATANAINIHDGMDGLSAGTSCQVFAVLAVLLLVLAKGYGDGNFVEYAVVCAVAAGSLCGFLIFNCYPAKIFMGDTGSLFIGGLLGGLVVSGGLVVWFLPLAIIYIVETLSVIAQVVYFKLTKSIESMPGSEKLSLAMVVFTKLTRRLPGEGKRLFRMAPIHHHFEIVMGEKGWSEWQVVICFWLLQFFLSAMVLIVFFALK
ncbi:MAG: phospho-N-acetylmuramoyl-pentapeptide-transferase, partial [Candidatus Obscuribacterales bacterium]|nr:phospho-N-acetylmuramoyl-pentapeptide-transferase [Candidatus Obscuribacterales bacterium]